MANHLNGMMSTSMEKIRELVDVNTIIGDMITTPDGATIIPISKVSFGFVSGGSDLSKGNDAFAGGASAGVSIKPQGFVVVSKTGDIKLLEFSSDNNLIDGIITGVPDLVAKIKDIFTEKTQDDESEQE
ncbi:MAG: GerW family sporulation protein [Oscillospiraceae bacterium]|nr:GerW family sporulation protein [Oscillospiraceae bacterium]